MALTAKDPTVMSALSAAFSPASPETARARPPRPSSGDDSSPEKSASRAEHGLADRVTISDQARQLLQAESARQARDETNPEYHEESQAPELVERPEVRPSVPPDLPLLENALRDAAPRLEPPSPRELAPAVPPSDES